jgi:hypothetical protein
MDITNPVAVALLLFLVLTRDRHKTLKVHYVRTDALTGSRGYEPSPWLWRMWRLNKTNGGHYKPRYPEHDIK